MMHEDSYKRGESLLRSMVEKSSVILRHLSHDFAQERGYGRFLQNERVSFKDVLNAYRPVVGNSIE